MSRDGLVTSLVPHSGCWDGLPAPMTRDQMDGINVYLQYFLQINDAVGSGTMLWRQLICKQDILLQARFLMFHAAGGEKA